MVDKNYRRKKRPLQKARREKEREKWHFLDATMDTEMFSVKSMRFPLNQLWISIISASFLDETLRVRGGLDPFS